jgi:transposase
MAGSSKLKQENEFLKHENEQLRADLNRAFFAIEKLEIENKRLREDLEKLKREKYKSAAPFSRNQPKQHPGTPGRKPGIGTFKYRTAPSPEEITKIVQVKLEQNTCESCGSLLEPTGFRFAWISELPELKPEIIEYQLQRKTCVTCGITVQATHPMISSNQVGVTAHRLGSRALALAHSLQYEMGVTVRKVPAVVLLTVGLRVTQGALTQSALKLADENNLMDVKYQALRENVQHASLVNTDDTGWRVAGSGAFLMAFKTASSLVYQIREQHRSDEVLEVIPTNFAGVMGCDRFSSYDAKVFDQVRQQKCVAHVLKNIRDLLEVSKGRACDFPKAVRTVFKTALRLHSRFLRGDVTEEIFTRDGRALSRKLSRLLRERPQPLTKLNERLRRGLAWHHARGSLLRFLLDSNVSPTNNAAEQALRPAVIFRKLCAGSKSWRGARALVAFKSVIESAKLSGSSGFDVLAAAYAQR